MKKQHVRKIIAPVAIVVVLLLVLAAYGFGMIESPVPLWSKWLVGGILAALGGVGIFVLVQRIHEIRSGEEDDLGHY